MQSDQYKFKSFIALLTFVAVVVLGITAIITFGRNAEEKMPAEPASQAAGQPAPISHKVWREDSIPRGGSHVVDIRYDYLMLSISVSVSPDTSDQELDDLFEYFKLRYRSDAAYRGETTGFWLYIYDQTIDGSDPLLDDSSPRKSFEFAETGEVHYEALGSEIITPSGIESCGGSVSFNVALLTKPSAERLDRYFEQLAENLTLFWSESRTNSPNGGSNNFDIIVTIYTHNGSNRLADYNESDLYQTKSGFIYKQCP